MRTVLALMNRNRKLFFKDKGMLFTSMITPVILIVLYATFLAKVFRDSFTAAIPDMITLLPPTALLGEDTHRHCTSIFLICCLTFPSDYSSFITYRSTKVKPFCKKEQVLRFFVDFCAKTSANGFSVDTFLLLHRQCTPPLFFIHIFSRILHKSCIQYTYTQLLSELSKHFFAEWQQILYSFCRFSL